MNNMNVTVIAGMERCDITYYIARALAKNFRDKTVLVVDNSISKDLFRAVNGGIEDDADDSIERNNIAFMRDIKFSEDFYDQFDFVIIYEGMAIDKEEISLATRTFILPEATPVAMDRIKMLIDYQDEDVILRDLTPRAKVKSIASMYGISLDHMIGAIGADSQDYAFYVELLYSGDVKMKNVSPDLRDSLLYILTKVACLNAKEAGKCLKKARG